MARNNKLLLMKKGDASGAPGSGDLEYGELAINYHTSSMKVYFKADAAQSAAGGRATALAIALG